MPRHRASNKKALGIYLTEAEHQQLRQMAEARGTDVTNLIRAVIRKMQDEAVEQHNEHTKHTNKKART